VISATRFKSRLPVWQQRSRAHHSPVREPELSLFLKIMTLTQLKLGVTALAVRRNDGIGGSTSSPNQAARENTSLHRQLTQLQADKRKPGRIGSRRLAMAKPLSDEQMNELLKLRGEVECCGNKLTSSKSQSRIEREWNVRQLPNQRWNLPPAKLQFEANETKSVNDIKRIGIAFHLFAGDHPKSIPTNIKRGWI